MAIMHLRASRQFLEIVYITTNRFLGKFITDNQAYISQKLINYYKKIMQRLTAIKSQYKLQWNKHTVSDTPKIQP